MYKSDIKKVLDYSLLEATKGSNTHWQEASYNWGMIVDVLDHLRDYLVDYGVRKFRKYLETFNAVEWWHNKSQYHLTTYLQEKRMETIMEKLRGLIL